MGTRAPYRPFSTFGWSLAGAALLAASLPPLGWYPAAWLALVPLLSRWALRDASWAYARELYAVFLTTSCLAGFWLLFHPTTTQALASGVWLFLTPLPLVAAFMGASFAKARWGQAAGLALLAANVVAMEYLLLHSPIRVPWLLLGHTQASALLFNQIADVGGVLLLSAWVLALNAVAFLLLPAGGQAPRSWGARVVQILSDRPGERGLATAMLALLLALPLAYGIARADQVHTVSGYLRVGLVQPNMAPRDWANPHDKLRVAHLAQLSNRVVQQWNGGPSSPTLSETTPVRLSSAGTAPRGRPPTGLLVWPQGSVPHLSHTTRQDALLHRLEQWSDRLNVGLLAGAETLTDGQSHPTQSSVFIAPHHAAARSDQSVRSPLFDDPMGDAIYPAAPFPLGRAEVASAVGFESLFGDHIRTRLSDADLLVVLAKTDQWGHSPGIYQHLDFTRLRAIETRRAVVVSTVRGVSSLIHPDGQEERLGDWMDQSVISVDAPIHRQTTLYSRWGDWVGLLGLALAVGGGVAIASGSRKPNRKPKRRARL